MIVKFSYGGRVFDPKKAPLYKVLEDSDSLHQAIC